jgi:hypothetical protein
VRVDRLLPRLGPEADHLLRDALRVLARHSPDPQLAAELEEVLRGERCVHAVLRHAAIQEWAGAGMAEFAQRWSELGPEERAQAERR